MRVKHKRLAIRRHFLKLDHWALRQLLPYLWQHPWQLFGAIAFLLASTAATVSVPLAARGITDYGFSSENVDVINSYFLAMLGVAAALGVASSSAVSVPERS